MFSISSSLNTLFHCLIVLTGEFININALLCRYTVQLNFKVIVGRVNNNKKIRKFIGSTIQNLMIGVVESFSFYDYDGRFNRTLRV